MNLLLTVILSGGGSNPFSLITPNPGLAIWAFIIFTLLIVILGKFAFKPIAEALKEREKSIEQSLMQAEKARLEMANLTAKNQELLDAAKEERAKILAEAREVADKLKAEIMEKAKAEAAKTVSDAKNVIELEKKAAIAEVKNTAGALALEVAEKLLRKNLSGDAAQKELVEALVKESQLN